MADLRFKFAPYPSHDSDEYAVWDHRQGAFVEDGEGTVIVFSLAVNAQRMAEMMNVRCP